MLYTLCRYITYGSSRPARRDARPRGRAGTGGRGAEHLNGNGICMCYFIPWDKTKHTNFIIASRAWLPASPRSTPRARRPHNADAGIKIGYFATSIKEQKTTISEHV